MKASLRSSSRKSKVHRFTMAEYPLYSEQAGGRSALRSQVPWGAWGLRLTALTYLGVLVAVPVLVVSIEGLRQGLAVFVENLTRPVAINAIVLTVWTAAVMAGINVIMGTLTAYVLVCYRFPGKEI